MEHTSTIFKMLIWARLSFHLPDAINELFDLQRSHSSTFKSLSRVIIYLRPQHDQEGTPRLNFRPSRGSLQSAGLPNQPSEFYVSQH